MTFCVDLLEASTVNRVIDLISETLFGLRPKVD